MVKNYSKGLADNNTAQFEKSLKELKDFSSQLYHAADYCEITFPNAKDKKLVVENTKDYISRAVVTIVDHLGSVSATLECCISKTISVHQTEHKLDTLKQRIATCQHYSYKISLPRFYRIADFSRYHSRYILPPSTDVAMMDFEVPRIIKNGSNAMSEKDGHFETEEPLFLYTYNCKRSLIENSTSDLDKNIGFSPPVLPVRDSLSILPKTEHSTFQFQETQKLKRHTLNWKLMQNKDITSLIRRGKRIIT